MATGYDDSRPDEADSGGIGEVDSIDTGEEDLIEVDEPMTTQQFELLGSDHDAFVASDEDESEAAAPIQRVLPKTTLPISESKPASGKHASSKRQLNLLFWIGIALIVVAIGIASYLLWRHFSALAGYNRLGHYADLDGSQFEDPAFIPEDKDLNVDWQSLKDINPDIIGFLYVPNTRLRYPIVQGRDNDYYLNHTADGSVNASGAIFLDYQNSADFGDSVNYVYGHNMLGRTMFSEMTKYTDPEFMREHPNVIILTPEKTYVLTVVGVIKCQGTDPVRRIFFSDQKDYIEFVNSLAEYLVNGKFDDLTHADNIYCFSTCELFDLNSRVIVIATDASRPSQFQTIVDRILLAVED